MPKTQPPTREQIARFGHIAAALRAVMAQRGWNVPDLIAALGKTRSNAIVYHWLACQGAPSTLQRRLIEKKLGIPAVQLAAREPGAPLPALPRDISPGLPANGDVMPPPRRPLADVLSFHVNEHGEARLRLDVTLPMALAIPLLRIVLDAGVVLTEPAP